MNKMFDDDLRDAVELAFASIFTPTATRSGKKLASGHKDKDLWWGCADGAGDDSVITLSKVQFPTSCV